MKTRKFVSIIMFAIIILTMTACGNSMAAAKKLTEHTAQTITQENVPENPVGIMQNESDELTEEIINEVTEIGGGKH